MLFSTELIPRCNVSASADKAFMEELQRTSPERYANLMRNMRLAAGAASLERRQAGGRPRKFKNNAARQRAHRQKSTSVTKPGAETLISKDLQR